MHTITLLTNKHKDKTCDSIGTGVSILKLNANLTLLKVKKIKPLICCKVPIYV